MAQQDLVQEYHTDLH